VRSFAGSSFAGIFPFAEKPSSRVDLAKRQSSYFVEDQRGKCTLLISAAGCCSTSWRNSQSDARTIGGF